MRRESLTLILSALLVIACLNFALGPRGLSDLLLLRHHRNRLENEREHEQSDQRDLQVTIAKLQSDDAYVQRQIRKELGYAHPNELIYRFAADTAASTAPNAP